MKNIYLKITFLLLVVVFLGAAPHANALLVDCDICTPCDLWPLAKNIVYYALYALALPILVVALLVGGIMILVSAGNQGTRDKGKALIWNGIIGILIAFVAYLVINTIIFTLANGKFTAGWASIEECEAVGSSVSSATTPPPGGPLTPTGGFVSCATKNGMVTTTQAECERVGGSCSACALPPSTNNLLSNEINDGEFLDELSFGDFIDPVQGLETIQLDESQSDLIFGQATIKVQQGAFLDITNWNALQNDIDAHINNLGSAGQDIDKTNIFIVDKATFDQLFEESFPDKIQEVREAATKNVVGKGLMTEAEASAIFSNYGVSDFGLGGFNSFHPSTEAVVICACSTTKETSRLLYHELIHRAIFNKFQDAGGDIDALNIFTIAQNLNGEPFINTYAGSTPAEMLAEAGSFYIENKGKLPTNIKPGTPAEANWNAQIDWLKKHGIIK